MQVPDDVICKVCKKIFCCVECRHKHEVKQHAFADTVQPEPTVMDDMEMNHFCPICKEKPLVLREAMVKKMLEHVEQNHLPLHCRRCAKVYTKIDDLKEFSKCLKPTLPTACTVQECSSCSDLTCDTDASKVSVTRTVGITVAQTTISTQTSPMLPSLTNTFDDTPISIINIRWKAKSKVSQEQFISDSVSSIKNISSISNSSNRRSMGVAPVAKGKLVRSTSTPVQTDLFLANKPKEQTFEASSGGGQVSSIYNSGCESDVSPAAPPNISGTPPKQTLDTLNRYLKVGGGRTKVAAATPLRQVMSKSIQKAFAEHGLPMASGAVYHRKQIFESIDTSSSANGEIGPGGSSPLDLRLSPALRRTQSEMYYSSSKPDLSACINHKTPHQAVARREILLSSRKLTTESIIITRRTQRLATSIETTTISSASNQTPNSNSLTTYATNSNHLDDLTSTSSVYKTCRSVEIITATELSEVNVEEDAATAASFASAAEECTDELYPLQKLQQSQENGHYLGPITPNTRIPGSVINKKLIKFESPQKMERHSCSPCNDVFFTPEATPVRKSNLQRDSTKENSDGQRKIILSPRNLNEHLNYPVKRPSLREFGHVKTHECIEDVAENYDNEVFLPEGTSTKEDKRQHQTPPHTSRPWSLSSIVYSVMRFPSLKASSSEGCAMSSTSLIKRCASIAGSLVRSKPSADDEQFQCLKRKRTYTADSTQYANKCPLNSNDSSTSANTSKRFRIQGRKPIERMRQSSS